LVEEPEVDGKQHAQTHRQLFDNASWDHRTGHKCRKIKNENLVLKNGAGLESTVSVMRKEAAVQTDRQTQGCG